MTSIVAAVYDRRELFTETKTTTLIERRYKYATVIFSFK
jgi:hypothetical protein